MVIIQIVARRNNLETAYLWIIETAKTTDVHKFSELWVKSQSKHCVVSFLPLHQNHLNVLKGNMNNPGLKNALQRVPIA